MSKMFKLVAGGLGIIGLFMMFLPQVLLKWNSFPQEFVGIQALVGGAFRDGTEIHAPVYSGLAGYILLGVGGLLILLCGLLRFFQEHDIVNYIVTGLGIVCLIVGIIMIFLIRKNFMDGNGLMNKEVIVGVGAMVGGSLGGLAIGVGGLGLILDFAK